MYIGFLKGFYFEGVNFEEKNLILIATKTDITASISPKTLYNALLDYKFLLK